MLPKEDFFFIKVSGSSYIDETTYFFYIMLFYTDTNNWVISS